jgi:hypothetical protein
LSTRATAGFFIELSVFYFVSHIIADRLTATEPGNVPFTRAHLYLASGTSASAVSGYIDNQPINKGQLLARIDDRDLHPSLTWMHGLQRMSSLTHVDRQCISGRFYHKDFLIVESACA